MIAYPSIQRGLGAARPWNKHGYIYAFDKLDGSHIRAEWSKKRGFYKFGTRKRLMDETDPHFGKAKWLIIDKYAADLGEIFTKDRQERAVAFFEFYGPNSFAGLHKEDDEHTVTLIDVAYNTGILEPKEFLKKFGHLDVPAVLWIGKANSELVNLVETGQLEGMTFEGVVCKGKHLPTTVAVGKVPLMFKIKNKAWIDKLKEQYSERFEELL